MGVFLISPAGIYSHACLPHARGGVSDVHDVIARLSVLTEMPKSKVITGLLEESLPTLLQVLQALETAKTTKKLDVSALEQLLDAGQRVLDEGQRVLDDVRSDIHEPK